MPTDEERLAALPLVNDDLLVLGENDTVTLPEGMEVDLGGIAIWAAGRAPAAVSFFERSRHCAHMGHFGNPQGGFDFAKVPEKKPIWY